MMRGRCLAWLVLAGILAGGCVSRGRQYSCMEPGETSPATFARLIEARDAQEKYRELFQRAATVDEAKAAETEVARLDNEIRELELRAAVERRGLAEPRTIIYGPVGFVLNATEWLLDKLFIISVR